MPHALQHKVKQRLHELSPRAFEFFAGDLLTFMGVAAVEVTRYSGDGEIAEAVLVEAFWSFYRARRAVGLPAEVPSSILSQPETATPAQVRTLVVSMPLERFVIQGYLQHFSERGIIRVRPEVWEGLRYCDVLALRRSLQEQIEGYFQTVSRRVQHLL